MPRPTRPFFAHPRLWVLVQLRLEAVKFRRLDPPERGCVAHVRQLAVKGPRRSGASDQLSLLRLLKRQLHEHQPAEVRDRRVGGQDLSAVDVPCDLKCPRDGTGACRAGHLHVGET
jgi:hypothetical protein